MDMSDDIECIDDDDKHMMMITNIYYITIIGR